MTVTTTMTMMERTIAAMVLWLTKLKYQPLAALACLLGQLYLYKTTGRLDMAREVYVTALPCLKSECKRV